jgi:6-phosphogluconate dehydrogenase
MHIGIIGLGKMGMQIARRLHKKGHHVTAWNRSLEPRMKFKRFGGAVVGTVEELVDVLPPPKLIWVMLPAGEATQTMLERLSVLLRRGDIVIDGSNSFFEDTIKRAKLFAKKRIYFFDAGTSGGVWGEKNGFALMVGGDKKIWPRVRPLFRDLAAGDAFGLVGPVGSGHFVKMVHNGIEYGMMEAIAEGYGLIDRWNKRIDLAQVTKIWQNGSVIRSWLIDLCRDIFETEDLSSVIGFVKATGEGEWTVKTGRKLGADVRVIAQALKVRKESKQPQYQNLLRNKLLALMRNRFGGHEVQRK